MLERFITAQAPLHDQVCEELRDGRKRSHWMWFVFPQLKGLGRSAMAAHFGIADREEAQAYWAHTVLGTCLKECVELVLAIEHRTANEIFGSPDDLKFQSCVTLFSEVAPAAACFGQSIERFYGGRRDQATIALLSESTNGRLEND